MGAEQCNAAAHDSLVLVGGPGCAVVCSHLRNATSDMNLDKASIVSKNQGTDENN
jgi:hypothetical protein